MPSFTQPSIHGVSKLTADVIDVGDSRVCLTLHLHGPIGPVAETEFYFSGGYTELANKYAAAINAVRP